MSKRLTTELCQERIDANETVHLHLLDPFVADKEKMLVRCETCLHERLVCWGNIRTALNQGTQGCPTCSSLAAADKQRKSSEQYIKEIKDRPTIALELYVSRKTKIKHQCTICDNVWEAIPDNILQGTGCPLCAKIIKANKRRKSNTEYIEEIKDRTLKALEPYNTSSTKIKHQCNICDNTWGATPNDILRGRGCPSCAKVSKQIRWDGERTEALKTKGLKIPLSLYILDGEDCIKVGITNNTVNRIKQLNNEGFSCAILEEYKLNAWDAIMIEQGIHKDFKRYTSSIKFKGYKELHYTEDLDIIKGFIEKKITTIVT